MDIAGPPPPKAGSGYKGYYKYAVGVNGIGPPQVEDLGFHEVFGLGIRLPGFISFGGLRVALEGFCATGQFGTHYSY